MFLAIIVNAAHAIHDVVGTSGAKGRITIRTRNEGGAVVVSFEDTGAGIPEAVRERIFDPLFTTKEVGRGSGQGLASAHAIIVRKHGGKLDFASEVGRGTTFRVTLPADRPRPGTA